VVEKSRPRVILIIRRPDVFKGILRITLPILLFLITLFGPLHSSTYVEKEDFKFEYDSYQVYMANIYFYHYWSRTTYFYTMLRYGYFVVPDASYFEILNKEYLKRFGIDIPE
jgi:hypothetical protein